MKPSLKERKQRGFVLVIVLWVLTLLGIIAGSFLRDTRAETRVAHNLLENAKAEAIADAGVQRAILGLLEQDGAAAWRADGTLYTFVLGEGMASIRLWNEAGKIDLNASPDDMIQELFVAAGVDGQEAKRLTDALIDFRNPGGRTEDLDYEEMGLPQGANNAPLEAIEELMQVHGVTRELFDRISSVITVHGGGRLDVLAAPPLVLQVLRAVLPEKLDQMIAERRTAATQISRPRTVGMTVEARTPGGGFFIREAVIQRASTSPDFRVLAWRHRWHLPAMEQ